MKLDDLTVCLDYNEHVQQPTTVGSSPFLCTCSAYGLTPQMHVALGFVRQADRIRTHDSCSFKFICSLVVAWHTSKVFEDATDCHWD